MLRVLLSKDLRRARRNPLPWLINLSVPLMMTALIGLVFGGGSNSGALGRIRFAVVDEDKSLLSDFLRGSANQREGGKYLEPVFMERAEAMRQINASQISAVLIIPTNFMRNYLRASDKVSLELIKNPAESIHPAVLEELLGVVVTGLNAISRNFNSEFPAWQAALEDMEDYHALAALIERAGDKLKMLKKFINPPLVAYTKEEDVNDPKNSRTGASTNAGKDQSGSAQTPANSKPAKSKQSDGSGIFAWLLVGMSGQFLLFLGQIGMTDLHKELRKRTLERYQTLRTSLFPFIASKAVFSMVMLVLCSLILLGGGGLVFQVHWRQPLSMIPLTIGYICFVTGLFAVLVALVPDERRATALNNIAGMAVGLIGGCLFPSENLPAFVRDHLTPLMPSAWFAGGIRSLHFGGGEVAWGLATVKLVALSVLLLTLAAALLRRKVQSGSRE